MKIQAFWEAKVNFGKNWIENPMDGNKTELEGWVGGTESDQNVRLESRLSNKVKGFNYLRSIVHGMWPEEVTDALCDRKNIVKGKCEI